MAERPTVLVDQDMVLADFDARVLELMTQRYPHVPLLAARTNFHIADDYPPEHAGLVRQVISEEGFVKGMPPIDGVIEGWERLLDLGYHPQACTAPIRLNPYSAREKLDWIRRRFVQKFGEWVVEEAILDGHKYRYGAVALIDDRPKLPYTEKATWQHVVFDQPYNQNAAGLRIVAWHDPLLPGVLEAAKESYRPLASGG
jgi:5'-nucleotidase